jgi:hypothetical protein
MTGPTINGDYTEHVLVTDTDECRAVWRGLIPGVTYRDGETWADLHALEHWRSMRRANPEILTDR